jgi:hypothetical protein
MVVQFPKYMEVSVGTSDTIYTTTFTKGGEAGTINNWSNKKSSDADFTYLGHISEGFS